MSVARSTLYVPHRPAKLVVLALAAVFGACAAPTEEPDKAPPPVEFPVPGNGGSDPVVGESCTPEVAGLVPTRETTLDFACPAGWRRRNAMAPISGRFTSYAELVDALCVADTEDSDPRSIDDYDVGVDFAKNDVYATPYDPSTRRTPALNKRGANELWIRVQTASCAGGMGGTSTYATALFVVPKDAKVVEQTCSASCQY